MTTQSLRAVPMSVLLITLVSALTMEAQPAVPPQPRWVLAIQTVDEALARKQIAAAERAWHEAYLDALGSRRWEGMVAVGDASLRIGEVSGEKPAARARARQSYLTALGRARADGSVEGVLRVARAFDELGDREVVRMCLRVARSISEARRDERGSARARD